MILIKTRREIEIMAEGGKILRGIMKELESKVKPGISTRELDQAAQVLVLRKGAECSFKGYQGFPACLCASVNEELVHTVPSARLLREGDILSLDLGILYKGYHSDMAITLPVGRVSPEAQRLIRVTKKALKRGLKKIRPGNTLGDIGNAIQRYVEGQGFSVVRDLCGHGIGKNLHEEPKILNYGKRGAGLKLAEGMVFCLEPMVTAGGWKLRKNKDGHGWETQDGSLSCHFEHQVAVIKNGYRILTAEASLA